MTPHGGAGRERAPGGAYGAGHTRRVTRLLAGPVPGA